ncbi:MAG: serine/threonine protein kinase [Deltaproteobacteria bacterium]|nr:serine/threonine protein kinase [Deltaproteobacteria bacterium]
MTTDIGTRLGDRYVLEHLIGKGGAARVYQARDLKTQEISALKVVATPPDRDEAELIRQWFGRELKALKVLDHPGVLRLIDHGETPEGEPFMVTEFLEGTDLKLAVEEHGALDEPAALAVIMKALSGLAAAHDLGIAHRDLKPANLFLCRDGRVVILDFGLARAMSENVGSTLARGAGTKLIGTPQFLSPEQVNGVSLSLQSDLFSFGATFYFLVSGVYAFRGEKPLEVLTSIVMNRRSHLGETAPHISKALVAAIDALLEPEPSRRPADARAALEMFAKLYKAAKQPDAALQRYVQKITGQTQFFRIAGAVVDDTAIQEVMTEVDKTQIATAIATQQASAPKNATTNTTQIATRVQAGVTNIATIKTKGDEDTSRNLQGPRRFSPVIYMVAGVAIGVGGAAAAFYAGQQSTRQPIIAAPVPPVAAPAPVPTATNDLPPPSAPEAPVPIPSEPAPPPVVPKAGSEAKADPKPAKELGTGTVYCVLKQWAEVMVDGLSTGKKQNAVSFTLAPGKHELEFVNTKYPAKKLVVVVKKNAETRVEVDFTK